jgi:hypothetical protein
MPSLIDIEYKFVKSNAYVSCRMVDRKAKGQNPG